MKGLASLFTNLPLVTWIAVFDKSEVIHLLFVISEACAVVPEPQKKSAIILFSSVEDRIILFNNPTGFCVG